AKLAEANILSYRLLLFERNGREFKAPAAYPRGALVAWSTHDLPTLAGWWQEEDLRVRRDLRMLDDRQHATQLDERRDSRRALLEALQREAIAQEVDTPAGTLPE